GQGCPQRANPMGHPLSVAGNHVRISLHNQRLLALSHGHLGQGETVEDTAFVKDGGLRRVEIFGDMHGFATLESPAPKRGGGSKAIVNGEHEAVSEAVVGTTLGLAPLRGCSALRRLARLRRRRAVRPFPYYCQPTLYQEVMGEPLFLHRLIQSIPRCRRVAQPKTDGHLLGQLTLATGSAGRLGRLIAEQTLMKERCCCLMQGIQRANALLLPLLRTGFRNVHPIARCQAAYCLRKGHVLVLHQKTEDIAAGVTAEAIKKPLDGADGERWRLFLM